MDKWHVLAGIIAAKEWSVTIRTSIAFASGHHDYCVMMKKPDSRREDEIIPLQRWTDGKKTLWLGYGPRSDTLVIGR